MVINMQMQYITIYGPNAQTLLSFNTIFQILWPKRADSPEFRPIVINNGLFVYFYLVHLLKWKKE